MSELLERFEPKAVNQEKVVVIEGNRIAFKQLVEHLNDTLPDGRCKAIVMTKLEEAAMFATKAISYGKE